MAKPVLKLRKVFFRWPGRSSFSLSLADLTVSYGEKLLLLGASGTGKSTLLSVISGTLLPDQGSVVIAKTEITKLSASARDRFRAEQLGVIFQQFNLLPFGSVADNILLPLCFAPIRRNRVKDAKSEVARLCAALGSLGPDEPESCIVCIPTSRVKPRLEAERLPTCEDLSQARDIP